MNCPKCKCKGMRVITTRQNNFEVIRERKCMNCGYRTYTIEYEVYEEKQRQYAKRIINANGITYLMNKEK